MEQLRTCTLLYVEDEQNLRFEMTAFLELHMGLVIACANGREALDSLADNEIDLVLTDIRMPEMDGLTLTETLHESSPELPVVLYTAFSDVPTLLRGIELGVAGFVPKPTDAGKLIATLAKAAAPVLQRRQIARLSRDLQETAARLAMAGGAVGGGRETAAVPPTAAEPSPERQPPGRLPLTMAEVEKWALQRALAAASGKKMVAARLLDMNYYTFRRHLARHGLDTEP